MKPKSILMPHACQKIGWGLLLLIPLVWGFYWILYLFFRETHLAVGISAFVCFIVILAFWILNALDHGFHFAKPAYYYATGFVRSFLPFLAAGLYYILFKTMLRHADK